MRPGTLPFATYATWWARQALERALGNESRLIRIPVHMHEKVRKVAMVASRLAAEGRSLSAAAVAVATNLTVAEVDAVRRISRPTDSLDREIGDGTHLGELIAKLHLAPTPEEVLAPKYSRQRVEELLARAGLTEREADVMRRRCGLVGGERETLDDIGKEHGVTRERIRQLETRARDRLKEVLEGRVPEPRGKRGRKRKPPAREEAPQPPVPTPVAEFPAPASRFKRARVPEGQKTLV
ncbi:sigma-70 family RNA polymerase sigma factor [Streptomyces sp. NPDC052043]|uniref:sigma-70 family RNA polymerase sigma factor n=1 Tax=Streptomyces sp. NPDC052043 TaxID=3365684 RepID=UPI0037D48489